MMCRVLLQSDSPFQRDSKQHATGHNRHNGRPHRVTELNNHGPMKTRSLSADD